jgi:hypothetical protein
MTWMKTEEGHNWKRVSNPNPNIGTIEDYICRDCHTYGRLRNGEIRVWNSLLSCKEARKKMKSHQFDKGWYCKECGLKLVQHGWGKLYYWSEVLDCDEAIIKGIIE